MPVLDVTVTSIMADVATVAGQAVDLMADVADEITAHPITVIACIAVPLCGLGVGFLRRLIHVKA